MNCHIIKPTKKNTKTQKFILHSLRTKTKIPIDHNTGSICGKYFDICLDRIFSTIRSSTDFSQ